MAIWDFAQFGVYEALTLVGTRSGPHIYIACARSVTFVRLYLACFCAGARGRPAVDDGGGLIPLTHGAGIGGVADQVSSFV